VRKERKPTTFESRNGHAPFQGSKRKGGNDRRSAILNSLWHLLAKKGYSSTSLTDIAREVGISVSHLLYYFPSKDALLEEMYSVFSTSVLSNIGSTQDLPAEKRCRLFADNMFLESIIPSSDHTIIFEMLAYAAHSPRFRRTQEKHTRATMASLADLFERAPKTIGLSPEEAAAAICAIWFGLLVVSYMYKPMNPPRVRTLFRQILMHVAGIEDHNSQAEISKVTSSVGQKRSTRKRSRTTSKKIDGKDAVPLADSSAEPVD
jgi:AcrR family transcriptional regulator